MSTGHVRKNASEGKGNRLFENYTLQEECFRGRGSSSVRNRHVRKNASEGRELDL